MRTGATANPARRAPECTSRGVIPGPRSGTRDPERRRSRVRQALGTRRDLPPTVRLWIPGPAARSRNDDGGVRKPLPFRWIACPPPPNEINPFHDFRSELSTHPVTAASFRGREAEPGIQNWTLREGCDAPVRTGKRRRSGFRVPLRGPGMTAERRNLYRFAGNLAPPPQRNQPLPRFPSTHPTARPTMPPVSCEEQRWTARYWTIGR